MYQIAQGRSIDDEIKAVIYTHTHTYVCHVINGYTHTYIVSHLYIDPIS